jgi:cysteine synthase A
MSGGSTSLAVVDSVLELVGRTPLVRLRFRGTGREDDGEHEERQRARLWAKMEQSNPGGSVKDRMCLAILERAERDGTLKPGGVVVEPTSGNTGIGLALVCAVKGYRCILTMPESMSLERRQLLEALGAQIILTPPEEQMDGAIRRARELASARPGAFTPSQFEHPATPRAHEETTGVEILEQMRADGGSGTLDAFVAGVGTGGTITGVARALWKHAGNRKPATRIVAVEPESCATISRGERGPTKMQGLAAGFVPANYDGELVDEVRTVRDEDAWSTKDRLARECGLLVGISAGANVHAALAVARELGPGKDVVTILCDSGERYFSLAEYFPS